MHSFAIGERAVFRKNPNATIRVAGADLRHGKVCVVLTAPIYGPDFVDGIGYEIEHFDGQRTSVGAVCLHKIDPPPQREELGEWELCPWRPVRIPATVKEAHD